MSFEYFIGGRYLRAKQKRTFISLITFLSIAGVTVGVMALMVVIAVMTGFESDLKARILKGQSHLLIMRHGGPFKNYTFYDPLSRRIYMIDISVYAPERDKMPSLRQLNLIARTFRTIFDPKEGK